MKLILSSCDFRNEESQKVIMDNLPCFEVPENDEIDIFIH